MDNLLGVVLCGGESRRMGSDKGLLPAGDTIWALSVAGKLAPFGIPVVFSVNEKQLQTYSSYISPDRLIPDSTPVHGPLKGLLSVHKKFPAKDLLLLACDMPDLDAATISKIISACYVPSRPQEPYDFFVYQDQGFAQPFCGIYTAGGLAREYASVLGPNLSGNPDRPQWPDFSLQSMLKKGNTQRLEIDRMEAFRNHNS